MARPSSEVVRRYSAAARSELGLFFVPLILAPLTLWALAEYGRKLNGDEPAPWFWYPLALVPYALMLLWAWAKGALSTKYIVTLDTVEHSLGLISRRSSLVRIADVRSITVNQSIVDRLLMIGDVAFSSAAGTQEEVVFRRVSNPEAIKRLVKQIQDRLANDGVIDERERAELLPGRSSRSARPAPQAPRPAAPVAAAPVNASNDDDSRDELYRLLAEQEAEEASKKR